jgi:hypothetical protein
LLATEVATTTTKSTFVDFISLHFIYQSLHESLWSPSFLLMVSSRGAGIQKVAAGRLCKLLVQFYLQALTDFAIVAAVSTAGML